MARAVYADWEDEDAQDLRDERPSRIQRKKRLPWLRLSLLSSSIVAGLVYLAGQEERSSRASRPNPVPPSALVAPAPEWKPIPPYPALYAFERSANPARLEARQHSGGAREDTLILGSFGDVRHARITLIEGSPKSARSFFIDVVRRAADAGLSVTRDGMSRMIASKFGAVEAAGVTLAGEREQECQAFRFSDLESSFGFQGWLCGSGDEPVTELQIACFLDGIVLAGAASPALRAVFARADRNRLEVCAAGARAVSIGTKSARQR